MNKALTYLERKNRYKQIVKLLSEGHTTASAGKIVGFSQPHISRLANKPWFKKRIAAAQEEITGKVKQSLVKRATGHTLTKEYQSLNKSGEVVELTETVEIPGDVKAQLAWLSAKDKDGGWMQSSNTINVQVNQALQGVSSEDLLLTLRTASKELSTGGEGGQVLEVMGSGVSVEPQPQSTISPDYNPSYDPFYEEKGKSISPLDNFHDHPSIGESTPVEGPLDNVGEDEEV